MRMNASQLLAWLVCLALATVACLFGVYNRTKLAVLERRFVQVERVAGQQTAVLEEIRDLLREMRPAPGAAE